MSLQRTKIYSLIALIFLATIYGCKNNTLVKRESIDFISLDFTQVLRIKHFETFKSKLNSQSLISDLQKSSSTQNIQALIQSLTAIEKHGDAIIAFKTDSILNYLVVTDTINLNLNFEGFEIDSIITHNKKQFRFNKVASATAYSIKQGKHFLMSNSLNYLMNALSKKENNYRLVNDFKVIDQSKDVSVINYDQQFLGSIFNPKAKDSVIKVFSDFSTLDINFESNSIRISGVTTAADSLATLQLFKNTIPQSNLAIQVFTANFERLTSLTLSDYSNFEANLSQHERDSLPNFINLAVEVAQIELNNNTAIALRFLDDTLISENILKAEKIDTFRDIDIYHCKNSSVFQNSFQPFIFSDEVNFVFVLNNFFVFSKTKDFAQQIITDFTNNNTIAASENFKAITPYLSNESSLLVLNNNQAFSGFLQASLQTSENITLSNTWFAAFQLIYEDSFAHVNGMLFDNNSKRSSKGVSEVFSLNFEQNLLNEPQFVINHVNRGKDIVIQDVNNTLYLISINGAVLWKKQLDAPIIGEISQIDSYKNGRLQLAFVTKNKLYVLDRNGNEVVGFPKNFNDDITQALSVFDYDNNKNYRLLITQNNKLLMLDKNGKTVRGFKPELSNSKISKQPQHFRIGNKDYIVFAQGNEMKILDRTGKTRIKVKEPINFSENGIFLNNNQFTTMTNEGLIFQVNTRGVASISGLSTKEKTQMDASTKSIVTFSENKLTINKKEVELDFGNYTKPKLYYLNDKIYVAITDLQTNKAYLFDSQGALIDKFPVYGNTTLILDNIDKNSDIEALTIGSVNSIILYQIQ